MRFGNTRNKLVTRAENLDLRATYAEHPPLASAGGVLGISDGSQRQASEQVYRRPDFAEGVDEEHRSYRAGRVSGSLSSIKWGRGFESGLLQR
jgi:hypothetical protein